MDRIWQFAWDRYGARYSWAICAVTFSLNLSVWLVLSFVVVAFEGSDSYVEGAVVAVVTLLVLICVVVLPGRSANRLIEQWAAGYNVDPATALDASYT